MERSERNERKREERSAGGGSERSRKREAGGKKGQKREERKAKSARREAGELHYRVTVVNGLDNVLSVFFFCHHRFAGPRVDVRRKPRLNSEKPHPRCNGFSGRLHKINTKV